MFRLSKLRCVCYQSSSPAADLVCPARGVGGSCEQETSASEGGPKQPGASWLRTSTLNYPLKLWHSRPAPEEFKEFKRCISHGFLHSQGFYSMAWQRQILPGMVLDMP